VRKERNIRRRLPAAYFAVLAMIGVLTVGRIGITWDEPNYFTSSYSYLSWFGHVFQEPSDWWASIDRYWEQSHEAPPFFKLWAGLFAGAGALVFGTEDLRLLGDAYRLGSYALFLLAAIAAFRFARREFGEAAAWGAALTFPLIPVLFGFARLGQLDGAAAALYLLAALALLRALERGGRGRVLGAGLLLGAAFATKLTVFPLPLAALAWVLVYRRGRAALVRLAGACAAGAAFFFALWPWLWRDPVPRTLEFLFWARGLQEERLTYYLGEWWAGAPWHYPVAALLVFTPLVVAAAGVLGAVRLFRGSSSPAAGWILIHLAFLLAAAGSGLVPVYGGPRQFLPVFPLWAICAGVGAGWLASRLRVCAPALLAGYAALALPGILWTGAGSSLEYYGEGVGLIPGAHAFGFETTYLANTYRPAVEYLNREAPEGATVYVQAGTYPVMETYRRVGELREDLRPAYLAPIAVERYEWDEAPREGSYFVFLPRQSVYTNQLLALERKEPLYTYEKGGVPLVRVYSGEQVGETLGIPGRPEPRRVGPLNALFAGGATLALLLLLRQQDQDEERKEQQVPDR
jgi:4-amino-4-deoxy-L-arabinose transferase-like glycosyltransferase